MNVSVIIVTAILLVARGLMHLYNLSEMEKEKEAEKESNWKYIVIFLLALLVVVVLCYVNYRYAYKLDKDERGIFGDMFGAVNALFSGLAFAGLIVTLIMQHDELKLQRKEISQTNQELAAQKIEFEKQNKNLQTQRFENTLFNMLSTQQRIVDGLIYEHQKGTRVFKSFYNETYISAAPRARCGIRSFIKDYGLKHYRQVTEISIFNVYFRHLYRIFKYIDESPLIDDSGRYEYTCIVRAQLSDYELLILFYNALVNKDNSEFKFKRLIEKYALFNNLKRNELARTENDEDYNLYKESAYKYQPNEDVSNKKS